MAGRGQAGDSAASSARTHERQRSSSITRPPSSGESTCGCGRAGWGRCGGGVCLAESGGAPRGRRAGAVVARPGRAHHDRAVDERRHRPELVGDQHDVAPRSFSTPSASASARWLGRSTPAVGSSRKKRSGSPARARAMSTRCCWPPDSVATLSAARSARPTTSSASSIARRSARDSGREQPAAAEPAGRDHLPHRRGYAGRGAGALGDEPDPVPLLEVGERACRTARPTRRDRPEAGQRPAPGSTCRSRWHPSAPRTRRLDRRGRCRAGPGARRGTAGHAAGSVDDRRVRQPFASSSCGEVVRIRDT